MPAFPLSLFFSPVSTTALSLVVATAGFAQPPRMTRISHSFPSRLTASATLATLHGASAPAVVAGGSFDPAASVTEDSLPPSSVSEDASLFTASNDSLFSTAGAPSTVATSPSTPDDWQSFDTSKHFVFGQADRPSSYNALTSFDFVLPNSPAKQFVAPRPVPSRSPGSIVSIDTKGDLYGPPSISLDFLDDSQLLSSSPPPPVIVPLFHPKPIHPVGNNLPAWIDKNFDATVKAPKRAPKIGASAKSLPLKVSQERKCVKPAALSTPEWLRADFFAGL